MYNPKKCLFLCLVWGLACMASYSQQNQSMEIKGNIIGADSTTIDYCNVILYSLPDTAVVKGATCYNGELSIGHHVPGEYLLAITSMGYEDEMIRLSLTKSIELPTVRLKPFSYSVGSVVVTARLPKIAHKNGVTEIRVSNTSLAHLPTVIDILGRAPGVRADESGISVIGRGTPEIYIDGRKVYSFSEVEMLQPNEIVSFEINKSPSARYAADVNSVVRIKTKRGTLEGFGVQLYNTSIASRRYSDIAGLRTHFTKGKFRSYIGYDYYDLRNKDYIDSYENNYLSSGTLSNTESSANRYNRHNHQLLFGAGYRFNPKHDLSFQYHLSSREKDSKDTGEQAITRGDALEDRLRITDNGEAESSSHIFSGTYAFTPSQNHKLTLNGDYVFLDNALRQAIHEESSVTGQSNRVGIHNKGKSNAYSFKLEYELGANDAMRFLFGTRYGKGSSDIRSATESGSGSGNYRADNAISDAVYAFYATFSHDFDKLGYELGLRNENSDYTAISNNSTVKDRNASDWFPSFTLYTNSLSEVLDGSFSYTSKITRPAFSKLNPARSYLNNLSYSVGNPMLQPTVNQNATLDITLWEHFNLFASYDYYKNPVLLSGTQDSVDPETIAFTPVNIDRSEEWNVGISYNNEWQWFALGVDGGVSIPRVQIPFLGELVARTKESHYLQLSTDFTVTPSTFLSLNWNYQSRCIDLMTDYSESHDLSVSLTHYLLRRRLSFHVSFNDILNKSHSDWFDKYGFVESGQRNRMDSRNVRFTLRYNFNNYRNAYRRKSNYDNELERLQ